MTNTQTEKIEHFLSGKMKPEEQKDFERELETDSALSAAFSTYRAVETHMANTGKDTGDAPLKNTLTKLGAEFFNKVSEANDNLSKKEQPTVREVVLPDASLKKISRLKNIQVWKLAAAVLFGVMITGTWYLLTKKRTETEQVAISSKPSSDSAEIRKKRMDTALIQDPTLPHLTKQDTGHNREPAQLKNTEQRRLFAKYFKPDAAPEDQEGPLEDAFIQYEQGQYKSAVAAFENADLSLVTRSQELDIHLIKFYASYYQALSYMAIRNDVKAIRLLKDLVGPDLLLQAKVQWYLALAYLRTGNIKEASLILRAVRSSNKAREYSSKANSLIIELDKVQVNNK